MKPPMPKLPAGVLTLLKQRLDEKGNPVTDNYGKPVTQPVAVMQARIRRSTKFIQGKNGQTHQCILEIDLPPEMNVKEGDGTEYHPPDATFVKGKVISVNEALNLAGNRVYYRTIYIE